MKNCNHENGDILGREQYRGEEWVAFKCEDCGRICLAKKDGLEQRKVVNTESSSEIIAYLMPSSDVPEVL